MASTILTGTWKLQSWKAKLKDGSEVYPRGQHPRGRLMYDDNGKMMVLIINPELEKFQSPDFYKATYEEMAKGFKNALSYFGSYELDLANKRVRHHVEACSFPNWIGEIQLRNFNLANGILTLSSTYLDGSVQELVWEK